VCSSNLVFYTIAFDKVHGPMKQAEQKLELQTTDLKEEVKGSKARFMLVPLITLIVSMVGFMFYTGNGVLAEGSGSKSVLYATVLAIVVAYFLMLESRQFSHHKLVETGFKGMGELLQLVGIVL